MITMEAAQRIAQDWISAWNQHDLDAIMEHYADDILFLSPIVVKRLNIPSGKIEDKTQLRAYFAQGLNASPELHFTLLQVFVGVDSIGIHYQRHDGKVGMEMMQLDDTHHIVMVRAHYDSQF